MPESDGELLQIKHVDPHKAVEFRLLAQRYKRYGVTQAEVFERLFDHAFEAVSRQLKEEKEERKEKGKSATKRGPRRRNGVGGGS
jgi:hypothetical protein